MFACGHGQRECLSLRESQSQKSQPSSLFARVGQCRHCWGPHRLSCSHQRELMCPPNPFTTSITSDTRKNNIYAHKALSVHMKRQYCLSFLHCSSDRQTSASLSPSTSQCRCFQVTVTKKQVIQQSNDKVAEVTSSPRIPPLETLPLGVVGVKGKVGRGKNWS